MKQIPTFEIESEETLSHQWSWLRKFVCRYTRRDGRVERQVREIHHHGHGAAVLPYDATRGTVLLVSQMRLAAWLEGHTEPMIEACAGLLDGDDPATCVVREAEEELGYGIRNVRELTSVFMTPGAVTEKLTLFLADYTPECRIGAGGGLEHEGEDIEVLEVPLTEAQQMALDGRISDAKTTMLLLYLERELAKAAPGA
jgi:nudix-type nucleoside diphosphatase (YffH/AdpP family)